MTTAMRTLTELATRHGLDLNAQPSGDVAAEQGNGALTQEAREALLEEALSALPDELSSRTRSYSSGSGTPTLLTTRQFQFDDVTKIREIALVDSPRGETPVYCYRLDSFHAWVRLLKALVGQPLYFRIPAREDDSERGEPLPRQKAV